MKRFLIAALLITGQTLHATHPLSLPAPEFPPGNVWINAKPLPMRILKGRRAVLVAFINTSNLNSLRTLEVLRIWHERYEFNGLMIIGVHTSEYPFQNDPNAIRRELKRLEVEFPIVIDREQKIWKSYANTGWPSLYLIDHKGDIVFDHTGEGKYTKFEDEIRAVLERVPRQPRSKIKKSVSDAPVDDCGTMLPEIHAGSDLGRPVNLNTNKNVPLSPRDRIGQLAYLGPWIQSADSLRVTKDSPTQANRISVVYRGAQVFALLKSPAPVRFMIVQDEKWLHFGNAGTDISFDEDGKSFVEVDGSRLYHLIQNKHKGAHELTLKPLKTGSELFSFSFSDWCLKDIFPGGE